jgi:hypothetical protein
MRASRTITGLVAVLLLAGCAATNTGGGSSPTSGAPTTTSDAPPSSEEPSEGDVKVELAKVRGITLVGEKWYIHTSFSFTVTATAPDGEVGKDPLTAAVSFPGDAVTVFSTEGEGWVCQDVDTGLSCVHADAVGSGEAWPVLTVNAGPPRKTTSDESISVEVSGPGKGSTSVALELDTST